MKKAISLFLVLTLICSVAALFAGCGGDTADGSTNEANDSAPADTGRSVLKVAMECAYAPYNWSQPTDANGAVPISGSADYANGYDVMIAKKICEANGWDLEIVRLDWDSLIPAVQSGQVDAVIAGQSMTAQRAEQVDFAGPYLYATIVCLTKKGSDLENAKGISDLAGHSCTSQLSTIWYDNCLPQIENADIRSGRESAPLMLTALETGEVDFVCCDMPTAQGALKVYSDFVLLDFAGSGDDFTVSDEEINIGISVQKGNSELLNAINAVLEPMGRDDFNALMDQAVSIQPIGD